MEFWGDVCVCEQDHRLALAGLELTMLFSQLLQ